MATSLKFGTSGLRGLASDLAGSASFHYTLAFLAVAAERFGPAPQVLVGCDRRESSAAISRSVLGAVAAAGSLPVWCGALPTPALALEAMRLACPAVMVSGSHIPADQNGLKFYDPEGEIDKAAEAAILEALAAAEATAPEAIEPPAPDGGAFARYLERYGSRLRNPRFAGMRIGVWGHSSVARDAYAEAFAKTFAAVERLGWLDGFLPVDTEAIGPTEREQFGEWAARHSLDAIVSTDADADRPLLADGAGNPLRGDLLGLLTARHLEADAVVTPVSSNSAIEETGFFARVLRTKIGSPYVIEGMARAAAEGARRVVGFEANGGVLLGSNIGSGQDRLEALPTRDALLPIVSVLSMAAERGLPLADLAASVPLRAAQSGRLQEIPVAAGGRFLARLAEAGFARGFFWSLGTVEDVSAIDGLRFHLAGGSVVHFRQSGNAPEMRCYVEAKTPEAAAELLRWGLAAAAREIEARA